MSLSEAAGPWRVELTRDAAAEVRRLPAVLRSTLADEFDAMADGPPAQVRRTEVELEAWSFTSRSGQVVHFVRRPEDRTILVFRIEPEAGDATLPSRRLPIPDTLREVFQEARFALRALRRAPAFTLGVVMTIAVGLGGAATIFGLTHTVFRGALPFADGDRVVRVRSQTLRADGQPFAFNVTPRDFGLLRDGSRTFEGVVAQQGGSVSLIGDGPPQQASVIGVSAGWATLLGIEPILGRAFTADEDQIGSDAAVAMISHALWQSRFGGSRSVIGSEVAYDGGRLRVVGVLPPRFRYPYDAEIWTPWRPDLSDWTSSDLNVVARLLPGTDVAEAQADVNRLYAELQANEPGVAPNDGFLLVTVREDFIRTQAAALQSLGVAVLLLLILVCVNVANLFVARRAALRREQAVRAALGAGRGRLVRGALVESMMVFAVGGALALAMVRPLGRAGSVLIPDVFRTQLDLGTVSVGLPMLAFTALVAIGAGLLTGGLAARSEGRTDLQSILRDGARGNVASTGRLRDALVVAEISLSLVLLVGAGVLASHFRGLQGADLGFRTEDVVTAQISLLHDRYDDPEARVGLVERLQETLARLPGVEAAGVTSVNPLCCGDWGARVRIDGLERSADAPPITLHHRYVTPEYFETLGIRIVSGRNFGGADRLETTPAVIIDEDLAARFWPGEDAVGRRIGMEREGSPLLTIVGVASRAHTEGDPRESWYLPFFQDPTARSNEVLHIMVRGGSVDVAALREAVASVDPGLAVFGAAQMADLRSERLAQDRVGAAVAATFAVAGLLLAAIGLYGLLAYQIELRKTELGTRVALGASGRDVAALVFAGTGRLLGWGLVFGLALSTAMSALIVRLVDGAEPAPPGLLAVLCLVLAVTAGLATLIPARRALGSDPAQVLRQD